MLYYKRSASECDRIYNKHQELKIISLLFHKYINIGIQKILFILFKK